MQQKEGRMLSFFSLQHLLFPFRKHYFALLYCTVALSLPSPTYQRSAPLVGRSARTSAIWRHITSHHINMPQHVMSCQMTLLCATLGTPQVYYININISMSSFHLIEYNWMQLYQIINWLSTAHSVSIYFILYVQWNSVVQCSVV